MVCLLIFRRKLHDVGNFKLKNCLMREKTVRLLTLVDLNRINCSLMEF